MSEDMHIISRIFTSKNSALLNRLSDMPGLRLDEGPDALESEGGAQP